MKRLNRTGRIGLGLILFFIFTGLLAPVLSPYDPRDYTGAPLQAPDREHWLGTNDLGQDIFSELLWGARISVSIGLGVGIVSMFISSFVALVSGVYGGWIDRILMRAADVFLAFPRLPMGLWTTRHYLQKKASLNIGKGWRLLEHK